MPTEKILGIDFGTTTSAVAVFDGGHPKVIPNAEGERTTPSVLHLTEDGQWLIGKPAQRMSVRNPERTIHSIKRRLGDGRNGVEVDGTEYSSIRLVAMILSKLRRDAAAHLGEDVRKAVLSSPASFTTSQRRALKDAGDVAGLRVERIIQSSSAGALAFGAGRDSSQSVLVYDLGGGTFDVSLYEIWDGVVEGIATAGHENLGGEDLVRDLTGHVSDDLEADVDWIDDGRQQFRAHLRESVRQALFELASTNEAAVDLPSLSSLRAGSGGLDYSLNRSVLDSHMQDLLDGTISRTQQVLDDAGVTADSIDHVLLLGWLSRMPSVQNRIAAFTGQDLSHLVNPDEAVAEGAAIEGALLSDELDDMVLLEVASHSVGLELQGGDFEALIPRNTTIPTAESKLFTTADEGVTALQLCLYEGEQEVAAENEQVGELLVRDIRADTSGPPQIEVTFEIDGDGLLRADARDVDSEAAQDVLIEGEPGLSDQTIERLQREVRRTLRDADRAEARTIANAAAERTRAQLTREEMVEPAVRHTVADALGTVEALLAQDEVNVEELRAATETLRQRRERIGRESSPADEEQTPDVTDGATLPDEVVEQVLSVRADLSRALNQFEETGLNGSGGYQEGIDMVCTKLDHLVQGHFTDDESGTGEVQLSEFAEKLTDIRDELTTLNEPTESLPRIQASLEEAIADLDRMLNSTGVTVLAPEAGVDADPHAHQVILSVESELPEGKIVAVEHPGFEVDGDVRRQPKVVVSSGDTVSESGSEVEKEKSVSASPSSLSGATEETSSSNVGRNKSPDTNPVPDVSQYSGPPLKSIGPDGFELGERIAQTEIADVYRATAQVDGESVRLALKEPHLDSTYDRSGANWFGDMVSKWSMLDVHEHIVGVIDWGQGPPPWVLMEYMDGGSLRDRLGQVSLLEATWIATSVTEAVRHAHKRGVIHTNLKPTNILFRAVNEADKWDVPKVGDWALAKLLVSGPTGVAQYSPRYAAPEQFAEKGDLSNKTDIYQLGIVLYELFTGHQAFQTVEADESRLIDSEELRPPTEVAPDLPDSVDEIVQRATRTYPADRYDDIRQLSRDLHNLQTEVDSTGLFD